jgi:hypothetical protein
MWRVGRHRLAWRPVRRASLHEFSLFRDPARHDEPTEVLSWLVALLATIVVLPWRIATNRWPVIAYVIYPIGVESQLRRTAPMPRDQADEEARRWAAHIERYGELPPQPDEPSDP